MMSWQVSLKTAETGLTLVEVVAFLIVMGVGAAALLPMLRNVLPRSPDSSEIMRATYAAQSRMELILGQRIAAGYAGINDPCQTAAPAACALPDGYSITVLGLPTALEWPVVTDTSRYRMVIVRVFGQSGSQLSQLDTVIANY